MAQVNIVEKKSRLSRSDSIKYQLITHCFIHKISLSNADIDILAYLALTGDVELSAFCIKAHEQSIFGSAQTARNSINRSAKHNLITKTGKNKKVISVNPGLQIQSVGNILLDYKFLSVEPYES